jgi:hypothetical protein
VAAGQAAPASPDREATEMPAPMPGEVCDGEATMWLST